jgi:mono/diheme cytochrome c family protein
MMTGDHAVHAVHATRAIRAIRAIQKAVLCAALLTAGAILVACGSARRSEPIAGLMKLADASVQRGQALFDAHCYKCHTQGEGGMGPIINDKSLPKFLMRFQVRHGLGTMPSFSEKEISDGELEDILNYLVALRHRGQ